MLHERQARMPPEPVLRDGQALHGLLDTEELVPRPVSRRGLRAHLDDDPGLEREEMCEHGQAVLRRDGVHVLGGDAQ